MTSVAKKASILGGGNLAPVELIGTRASIAYDHLGRPYPINELRFENKIPLGTVTNLLNGAQSDGCDTLNPELLTLNQRTGTSTLENTDGFTPLGTTPPEISSSTEQAHSGTRSLKVDCAGSLENEGVQLTSPTVVAGTTYLFGVWVYAPAAAQIRLHADTGGFSGNFTWATTGWKWCEITGTAVGVALSLQVKTTTSAQDITFYVDDPRLATSVTTGLTALTGATVSITGEMAYTGYRSIKCVTLGSVDYEGVATNYGFTNGTTYAFSGKIWIPTGATIKVIIKGTAGFQTLTGDNTWQTIQTSQTATATSSTVYIYTNSIQATTFYLDYQMAELGSVFNNWAYGGSSYTTGYTTTQGVYVGEAVQNLLSANQSTGTDTNGDTVGFTASGTVSPTISSSTDQFIQGTKSLKCITSGTGANEGLTFSTTGLTDGATYTLGVWLYVPLGNHVQVRSSTSRSYITGTGAWQFTSITRTLSGTTSFAIIIDTPSTQAVTFYCDMLQLTATAYPYPQDWVLGGTTKQAEQITAPSPVLNIDTQGYNNILTLNQSNIETNTTGFSSAGAPASTLSRSDTYAHEGTYSLKVETPGGGSGQGAVCSGGITTVIGVTYTFSGWLWVPTGTTIRAYWAGQTQNIVGNDDWQQAIVTATTTGTSHTLSLTTSADRNIAFYLDELQVTATSSVKPWIPGGTQSNTTTGTIEVEFYPTPATIATARLFEHYTSSTSNRIVAYRGSGAWRLLTTDNVGNGTYIGSGLSSVDGVWNEAACRYDSTDNVVDLNGVKGTPLTANNMLPNTYGTLIICGGRASVPNMIYRNLTISKPKRTDTDITNRNARNVNGVGFGTDRQVSLYAPLTQNLKAWRVIA